MNESKEHRIKEALKTNPELQKLAKALSEPVRHALEDSPWSSWYSSVVPDSGFWTSIDQMINYFTQIPVLNRREILVHLENMKKRGYSVEYDPRDDETLNPMESRFAKEVMRKPVKWGWCGEGINPEHKGIMGQVREAGARGEIKPYSSMTKEDFEKAFESMMSTSHYPVEVPLTKRQFNAVKECIKD